MQFLEQALEPRKRWMQLRNLLLLMMRMAALALLVLALARPRLPLNASWPLADGAGMRVVLILDDTASTGVADADGRTCFSVLRRQALEIIDRYASARFAVVFVSKSRAGEWLAPGAARAVVEGAEAGAGTGDLPRALAAARTILEEEPGSNVVFVLSDHQQTAWPTRQAAASAALAKLSQMARICMFGLEGPAPDNAGIVELTASPYPVVVGKEAVLEAKLTATGKRAARSVRLWVDGGNVAAQVVQWQPPQTATVSFPHTFDEPGTHRVEVRLEADALPVDDVRYSALDVVQNANVLCVTPQSDGQPGLPATAFVQALIESAEDCSFVFPEKGFQAPAWPEETSVLITADLPELPPGVVIGLRHFLDRGGVWLCFTGPNVNVEKYASLARDGILPANLGGSYGAPPDAEKPAEYFQIDSLCLAHPMFDCGEDPEFSQVMFSEPRFYMAHEVTVAGLDEKKADSGDEEAAGHVIARFNNGRNFAIEGRVGKGIVLLFASTCDLTWNTLPLTPAFVLVDRALQHALGSTRPLRQRRAGEPLSCDVPGTGWKGQLLLPDGSRRPGLGEDEPDSRRLRWTSTDQVGFYTVEFERAGARPTPKTIRDLFAFNVAAEESDLERLTWEQIRKRYEGFDFTCQGDSPGPWEVADEARQGSQNAEVSRLLALLAVGMLLIESVFAAKSRNL
jgi:hypothetical protein